MPLSYQDIYKTIQESFPDTLVMVEDIPGDPFAVIPRDDLVKICQLLRDDQVLQFDFCSCVSGIDDTKTFWVVYHLYSITKNHDAVKPTSTERQSPLNNNTIGLRLIDL